MKKITPRQEIEKLNELNGDAGFYGTHHQFVILIENELYQKAMKIMNDLNPGFLWRNEREVHTRIYNYLLDGITIKQIKSKFK
jgi:hypothetical protein